ncbi:MAG: heavy-metal-associated domain-containing protein [Lachnospiraceae bacterium]|nr:heavy-metal-associated domain-containing protein [Lachnospiraceae bacterium]
MYQVTAKIDGMMCSMCEAHINETVRKTVPSAKKVKSSHKKGETTFLVDQQIDLEMLKSAIEQTGYHALDVSCVPYEKKGIFG